MELKESGSFQKRILEALQSKPIFQGVKNVEQRARRRAKNKVAKQSRKTNR